MTRQTLGSVVSFVAVALVCGVILAEMLVASCIRSWPVVSGTPTAIPTSLPPAHTATSTPIPGPTVEHPTTLPAPTGAVERG